MTKLVKIAMVSTMVVAASPFALAGDARAPAADPKTAGAPAMPMTMPKPAPEVADMAKSMTGNWKCEGTAAGMDGKMEKMKATMSTKADLDGFWVHDSFVGGGDKGPKFKMESFSTFDASSKKWRRVTVMNDGGQMVGTSDGMKDMKMDFALDASGPMGTSQFKDHLDASDMKKGVHAWGEMSMDKGKTWVAVYDMTCKK